MRTRPSGAWRATGVAGHRGGTASAELVVALPTLIVILAAVFYLFRVAEAEHGALGRARACAWDFALHSCDPEATTLCEGVNAARGAAHAVEEDSVLHELEKYPLLGDALQALLGEPALASLGWSVAGFMGAAQPRSGTVRRALVCAPSAESLSERAKGALCDLATKTIGIELYGCP